MNSEESRLRTFANWPENAPVDHKKVAKAGFYYMGQRLDVQCFSCGSRVSEWNYGDKVMARHKSLDPRCPFVLNPRQSGNVPMSGGNPQTSAVAGANPTSSVASRVPELPIERQTSSSGGESASQSLTRQTSSPYHDEAVRLASFDEWPYPSVVSPAKLAQAGFYYTNDQSKVMCAYCDGLILHWNPGDDPELIHQRCYPNCSFINERLKYRMHPYSNISIRDPANIRDKADWEALKSLGVYYHRIPRSPKYLTVQSRLKTFENWLPTFNQQPDLLADAGFYYTGVGDKVRCFHCDGGLKDWKKSDIPWLEHARWFSDCPYLNAIKGSDYIQEALKTIPASLRLDMEDAPPPRLPGNHSVTENFLQSLMSSPAARIALEIGIEASRVKTALRQKVSTTGSPYKDDEANLLIIACMDLQSEEESSTFDDRVARNSPFRSRRVLETREFLSPDGSDDSEDEGVSVVSPASSQPQPPRASCETTELQPKVVEAMATPQEVEKGSSTLEEENRLLKEARLCKVCLDREVVIVFLPCAHLVTCFDCAQSLKDCPLCRQSIKATVRTFLS